MEPTFKNLTPEAVDRYPVLVELVAADEPFTKVNLGCDQQEEIWAYLGDQGYVSEHESLETAWVAWEGEKEGIGRNRQVN